MLASCRTGGSLAWTWDLEKAVVVLGKDSGKRGMAGWLVAHGRLADHNTGASRSTSTTTGNCNLDTNPGTVVRLRFGSRCQRAQPSGQPAQAAL